MGDVCADSARLDGVFIKKGFYGPESTNLGVSSSSVVIKHLCYPYTNSEGIRYYHTTGWRLRSYTHYFRHRIIPKKINLFPIGSPNIYDLPSSRLDLRPFQISLPQNPKKICLIQTIPSVIPI